jgi:hypothetical protein
MKTPTTEQKLKFLSYKGYLVYNYPGFFPQVFDQKGWKLSEKEWKALFKDLWEQTSELEKELFL